MMAVTEGYVAREASGCRVASQGSPGAVRMVTAASAQTP